MRGIHERCVTVQYDGPRHTYANRGGGLVDSVEQRTETVMNGERVQSFLSGTGASRRTRYGVRVVSHIASGASETVPVDSAGTPHLRFSTDHLGSVRGVVDAADAREPARRSHSMYSGSPTPLGSCPRAPPKRRWATAVVSSRRPPVQSSRYRRASTSAGSSSVRVLRTLASSASRSSWMSRWKTAWWRARRSGSGWRAIVSVATGWSERYR